MPYKVISDSDNVLQRALRDSIVVMFIHGSWVCVGALINVKVNV